MTDPPDRRSSTVEVLEQPGRPVAMTGGEAVVRGLERHGVRHVFGIPGDHTIPIYAALGASAIDHWTARHEQGAGFMADGYARVAGRPGVAIVIGGPGLTNIATAMGEAYADGVPLLVVSADTPRADRGVGRDHNHEMKDQTAAAGAICAWSARAENHQEIVRAIDRAFAEFASGRGRAVHLGVPIDLLAEPGAVDLTLPAPPPAPAPDPATVRQAASLLRPARRGLVLLGGGARAARTAARRAADALGLPVMTTWSGTDAFPGDHPLAVGGGFHLRPAIEAIEAADVVLAVGTRLGRSDFWHAPAALRGRLVRVDVDRDQLTANASAAVAVHAEAGRFLEALADELGGPCPNPSVARAAALRAAIDAEAAVEGERYRPWLAAIRRALPADGVIAMDSTLVTYRGFRWLPIPAGGRWLYPNAYGTLGYALPAAIGGLAAEPARPAVVVIGDGGLLFTCAELLTAGERGLSLPVVVWNDRGYGCIRAGMRERGVRPLGVDFAIPDLAALARAFGAGYAAPGSPPALEAAVRGALGRGGPTVIEVDDRAAG